MDDEKRRLRDEVAELAEAVRELRGQLAQQPLHVPGQCCCGHAHIWYYQPLPPVIPAGPVYPGWPGYQITCGTTTENVNTATLSGAVSYS